MIPPGVPDAFLEPVPDAATQLIRRWARTHGPFVAAEPAVRFGYPLERVELVLQELVGDGTLVVGAFRPNGKEIASGGFDGLVYLNDPQTGKLIKQFVPVPLDAASADKGGK